MTKSYNIEIKGLNNLNDFVSKWSKPYSYSNEEKYNENIVSVFEKKESFIELFKWKNGTGDNIYQPKMNIVLGFWDKIEILRELKMSFNWNTEFNWELFEKEFEPQKNSTIWKIFLLHLVNHYRFPIFDQHVYRTFHFFQTGIIDEIPKNSKLKYQIYKDEYFVWFNQLYNEFGTEPRNMDKSFFTFGQMLKKIKEFPIQITEQ